MQFREGVIYRIVGPSIGGYRYDMGREGPITEVSNDGNIMLGNMAFIYPPGSLKEVAWMAPEFEEKLEGQRHPNGTIVYFCALCGNYVDISADGSGECEECSAKYSSEEIQAAEIREVA